MDVDPAALCVLAAVLAAASCGVGIGLAADVVVAAAVCIGAVGSVVDFGAVRAAAADADADLVTADDAVGVVVAAFVAAVAVAVG